MGREYNAFLTDNSQKPFQVKDDQLKVCEPIDDMKISNQHHCVSFSALFEIYLYVFGKKQK